MKTLVTGANGLLGANVVRELEARGREVRILARPNADLSALVGTDAEVVVGDILDVDSLNRVMRGCDSVIHAAAKTKQWPVSFESFEPVNVTGTHHVVSACKKNGIERLVYVSTANAFGPGTKEDPGTELSEFSGYRLGSGYITSKYVAQQNVLSETEKHGLPAVIVNPTFMIGPYDSRPSSGTIILLGLKRGMQFSPSGGKNFIHVRDAAIGVCNALDRGRVGECYLLANKNLTYREFFRILNRVAGKCPVNMILPSAMIHTAGFFGTLAEKVTGRHIPLNRVNARCLLSGTITRAGKPLRSSDCPRHPSKRPSGRPCSGSGQIICSDLFFFYFYPENRGLPFQAAGPLIKT